MTIRIAINGFGRIGRNVCRALYESQKHNDIKLVAINDLGSVDTNAHLLKYDTTHGLFNADISTNEDFLIINGDPVKICTERDPNNLPWKELNIDVVLECTGFFNSKNKASAHLNSGAKKVVISAPAGNDLPTIVYGVNHHTLKASDNVISNASCTTNALSPLIKPIHDQIGIEFGLMNTIHSYTNDQVLCDTYHSDLRRARSATQSMIPTKTGAASAVGLVIPELNGKLEGFATRVPTINVSLVDITFTTSRDTSLDEINSIIKSASTNELNGILDYNSQPLVSSDFNHNPASSVYDESMTRISGNRLVKICSWYDNEWGFSNRMLDTTVALMNTLTKQEEASLASV